MMRKVIGIGETIFDVIFKNGQPIGAVPGGSTFNSMVSLARSGVTSSFISGVGNDCVGNTILQFLQDNGIDSTYVQVFNDVKSPVSLAFLNEQNDAQYLFYKQDLQHQTEVMLPEMNKDDIVLLGSYYAVDAQTRAQVVALLDKAKACGAIVYYDINYRSSHANEIMKITPNLIDNLEYADVVRGSREDFEVLYKKDNPDVVYKAEMAFYCKRFIYTNGAKNVTLYAQNGLKREYEPAKIQTVSTIGAGDSFNAGFVFGLIKEKITREMLINGLTNEQWDCLINYALKFSENCCKDIYNYVSTQFGMDIQQSTNI